MSQDEFPMIATDGETVADRIARYTEMSVADARARLAADAQLSPTQRAAMLGVIEWRMREYYRELLSAESRQLREAAADEPSTIH